MKRIATALVAAMLVASISIAAFLASQETDGRLARPSGELPTVAPRTPAAPEIVGVPGPLGFGALNSPDPAGDGTQSRLWYADGAWWGVLLAAQTNDHRIFRLDAASLEWIDTGVTVDERPFARMDVLWDGRALVVASAGPRPDERHALRISRFSYDATRDAFRRDANFPLPITTTGVDRVTLDRAADGQLWVAYRQAGRLLLDHSTDSDLAWRGPFGIDLVRQPVDAAALAAVGDRMAVVWTVTTDDALNVAWHDPGEETWRAGDVAPIPNLSAGEDAIGLAVDRSPGAERLLVAVRTSADRAADRRRLNPLVVLADISPTSVETHLVSRVEDGHGSPALAVDAEARVIHVLMPAPSSGGTIYDKRASLDQIQFPAGAGEPVIPVSTTLPELGSPTTTKQSVDGESGLVVAATAPNVGRWGFGAIGVSASEALSSPGPIARELLVNHTFEGLALERPVGGWDVDGDPPPVFVAVGLTGADTSGRLTGGSGGARACTRFTPVTAGRVRAGTDALFDAASAEDVKLIALRGPGGEVASIRLRDGEIVWSDGEERVRSGIVLASGRWYRAVLTLDIDSRTFGVEVRDGVDDQTLVDQAGYAWRSSDVAGVDQVCAELAPQSGVELYLDDVWVRGS